MLFYVDISHNTQCMAFASVFYLRLLNALLDIKSRREKSVKGDNEIFALFFFVFFLLGGIGGGKK